MKPRQKRLVLVLLALAGVGIATALATVALRSNLSYYYSPTQVSQGEAPMDQVFRVGGLVVEGSMHRQPGDLTVEFMVTDNSAQTKVRYAGILPDLFREGQGVVTEGRLDANGVFIADSVLAKHDETYMPPEVAKSLKEKGVKLGQGATHKMPAK